MVWLGGLELQLQQWFALNLNPFFQCGARGRKCRDWLLLVRQQQVCFTWVLNWRMDGWFSLSYRIISHHITHHRQQNKVVKMPNINCEICNGNFFPHHSLTPLSCLLATSCVPVYVVLGIGVLFFRYWMKKRPKIHDSDANSGGTFLPEFRSPVSQNSRSIIWILNILNFQNISNLIISPVESFVRFPSMRLQSTAILLLYLILHEIWSVMPP